MAKPEIDIAILVLTETSVHFMKEDGRSLLQPDHKKYELVICLDMDEFNSIGEVKRTLETVESRNGVMLVAALGTKIHDMTELMLLVEGITQRPTENTFEGWLRQVEPLVIGKLFPDYKDELDPSETWGAVSQEEFAETLRRSSERETSSTDPHFRCKARVSCERP